MPLFEYSCRACGEQFEILTLSAAQGEAVRCPQCGSSDVAKMMSASRFHAGTSPTPPPCAAGGCPSRSGFS